MTRTIDRGSRMNGGRRARAFAITLAAAALGLAALTTTASAHELRPYQYQGYFDGHDATAGAFTSRLRSLTIDQSNGRIYALDQHGSEGQVSQFDPAGHAVLFPALNGSSTINLNGEYAYNDAVGAVQFDWTPFNGGLYVAGAGGVKAYHPDGSLRWGPAGSESASDIAPVVPDGSVLYTPTVGTSVILHEASNGAQGSGEYFYEGYFRKLELGDDGFYYYTRDDSERGLYKGQKLSNCAGLRYPEIIACQRVLKVVYTSPHDLVIDRTTDNFYVVEEPYDHVVEYSSAGQPINSFGLHEGAFAGLSGATGIAVNEATKDVYVTSLDGSPRVDIFHQGAAVTVPDVSNLTPIHPNTTSATLRGAVKADGGPTTACKFEWGPTTQYTNTIATEGVPCEQGEVFSGSEDHEVTLHVSSLTKGSAYHYRVASKNANGYWSYSPDLKFEGSVAPTSPAVLVDNVNTDGARFTSEINPNGGATNYHFEVGTQDCASNPCQSVPVPDGKLESNLKAQSVSATIQGLEPDTVYFVRLVAENDAGTATPSSSFHTFASPPAGDPCSNAQVRQQTAAYLLPDCRAYELVSAANAGGYDVESTIVPNQTPLVAHPNAHDRALYGLHFGSIPNIAGSPTNYGLDPYVAERTAGGWLSRYVGLPADGMADPTAFGSPLLGSDEQLNDFAFGGPGICDPCFSGLGTNLPVRLDGGPPTPGMAGSEPPGESAPAGVVGKYMSADGSHLVFGSTRKYEPGGVAGQLTMYERDLRAGVTEVVSTDDNGAPISGPGTAALDVSEDGSSVVVGKLITTDAAGNGHYHLYLHRWGDPTSTDLTPNGSALFSGMTADGSRVFMTTTSKLLTGVDTDESADIYEAKIDAGGNAVLRLITTTSAGTPVNSDTCSPAGSPNSWNSPSGPGMCNAVAFAGGAGVAADEGTFYFATPELLEGSKGEADQANLYVVKPDASPHFVATIDSSLVKPGPPHAQHPPLNANFASATAPEALAVDQSSGDVYVLEQSTGKITRFDSSGNPKAFATGPGAGTNSIPGFLFFVEPSGANVSIYNHQGSPYDGDIYVASYNAVTIWAPNGAKVGELNGSGTNNGYLGFTCGVSVDNTTGSVYVSDYFGYIWKYTPSSPTGELTDADFTVTGIQTNSFNPCVSAADGNGHVYASQFSDGPLKRFDASAFTGGTPPGQSGTTVSNISRAVQSDQVTHEIYVSEGSQVAVFDEEGERVETISGEEMFSGARGVAVNSTTGHVYVSSKSGNKIAEFGYYLPPYIPIDNPGIAHGVNRAGQHSYGDFQVTRDGRFAAFTSVMPLTGYQNLGHSEIFRYDTQEEGHIDCASCATTLAPAKTSANLSAYGLNISADGRVFFTSGEGLVLSDTNEKTDAYEWHSGRIGILSSGRGLDDSALLSASEDGKDAFFFTRDVLVPEDENGGAVKIYDAREGGGFLRLPIPQPCAASDECHGAGTQAPPPPNVNSLEGPGKSGYGPPPRHRCKKGFVRRRGKCVRKHRHHHRRRHHRHGGHHHG